MQQVAFLDWTVLLEERSVAIIDSQAKTMVIMEKGFELYGVFWIDEKNTLQMKPTWDCVISVDASTKELTIKSADAFKEESE